MTTVHPTPWSIDGRMRREAFDDLVRPLGRDVVCLSPRIVVDESSRCLLRCIFARRADNEELIEHANLEDTPHFRPHAAKNKFSLRAFH